MPFKDPDKARANKAAYREKNRQKLRDWAKNDYLNYREDHLAQSRSYHLNNLDKRRDYELRRMYGITLFEYDALAAKQDGVCAICCRKNTRRLSVDHCHTSGKVRGLLCDLCNRGLGMFQDSPDQLESARQYLIRSRKDASDTSGL